MNSQFSLQFSPQFSLQFSLKSSLQFRLQWNEDFYSQPNSKWAAELVDPISSQRHSNYIFQTRLTYVEYGGKWAAIQVHGEAYDGQ